MSPRAACRLESLGFREVFDYESGIADWKAAGLPIEGEGIRYRTAADAMRPDIPTGDPAERIGVFRDRVVAAGWNDGLVVECGNLVVGRLRSTMREMEADALVGEAMELGPSTVRASEPLDRLVERMDRRPTDMVVVSTAQGGLLGVVFREQARRILDGESVEIIWAGCDGCPGQWRAEQTQK